MTAGEEELLRAYLACRPGLGHPDGFEAWYAGVRDGSDPGEVEYKHMLDLAREWRRSYVDGYRAGARTRSWQ